MATWLLLQALVEGYSRFTPIQEITLQLARMHHSADAAAHAPDQGHHHHHEKLSTKIKEKVGKAAGKIADSVSPGKTHAATEAVGTGTLAKTMGLLGPEGAVKMMDEIGPEKMAEALGRKYNCTSFLTRVAWGTTLESFKTMCTLPRSLNIGFSTLLGLLIFVNMYISAAVGQMDVWLKKWLVVAACAMQR